MRALIRCSLCMVLGFNANLVFSGNCALTRVSINPIESNRTDVFVGKGKTIEIQFRNESTKPVVDVFPEPPLTVSNQASGRRRVGT
jgi:Immune protein Tsi1